MMQQVQARTLEGFNEDTVAAQRRRCRGEQAVGEFNAAACNCTNVYMYLSTCIYMSLLSRVDVHVSYLLCSTGSIYLIVI